MKFVDEAVIWVEAGSGGDGCLGFRREKYVAFGGPDGGDGGDGGSIFLVVKPGMNTLLDFRYKRLYRAQRGQSGMGQKRIGKSGGDLLIDVPLGTLVYDDDTGELLGDLVEENARLLVAQGGFHGLGNTRFKSSTNRAPRQTTKGSPGEQRNLRLELQVLADVGLMGMPNAGKSTFISAVSAARPKIADYPFTTIYPNLGVVRTSADQSFVVADIPGLIEGAAEGAGLGIRFLKHLSRTRLLLHLLDIVGTGDCSDPVRDFWTVDRELKKFSGELYQRKRWLILNKIDLLPEDQRKTKCQDIVEGIGWKGPVYAVSAVSHTGCQDLVFAIQNQLEEMQAGGPSI